MAKNKFISAGLLAGLLILILGFLLNFVFGWLFPSFQEIYTNTDIFLAMDNGRGLLFFLYPFSVGIGLAWIFNMLKSELDLTSPVQASLKFAWIYFVIAAIPAFFINTGSFNLPVMMIITWTILNFLNGWVAGYVFCKMLK